MADLDALSREIAATSPAWALPGVEAIADGGRIVRIFAVEGALLHVIGNGSLTAKVADCRPNLRDRVSRLALLEERRVSECRTSEDIGDYYWCGPTDAKGNGEIGPDVITAVCRAWIAAHGEKGK